MNSRESVLASPLTADTLGVNDIEELAAKGTPGASLTSVELESQGDVVVYGVRFTDGSRVDVNALNGTVVRVKSAQTTSTPSTSTDNDSDIDDSDSNDHSDSSGGGSSGSGSGSGSSDDGADSSGDD